MSRKGAARRAESGGAAFYVNASLLALLLVGLLLSLVLARPEEGRPS